MTWIQVVQKNQHSHVSDQTFFSEWVINVWNDIPADAVDFTSLLILRNPLCVLILLHTWSVFLKHTASYRVLHGNAPRHLGPLTSTVDVLVEELCVLPELTVWSCLQSDWLRSAAELFRSPLPTPGTLFLNTSSQLLRCSNLNVIWKHSYCNNPSI